MKSFQSLVLVLLVAPSLAVAQTSEPGEIAAGIGIVDAYKGPYTRTLDHIESNRRTALEALMEKYQGALEGLKERRQKAADLNGVLAVNKELERIAAEKTPPADAEISELKDLADLQKICLDSASKLETKLNREIVELTGNYLTRLEEQKKALTVSGKITEAQAMQAEIARVTMGERQKAAYAAIQGSSSPAEDRGESPAEAGLVEDAYGSRVSKGIALPNPEGFSFADLSMQGTRLAGRLSGIDVSAEHGTSKNMDTSRSSSSYNYSRSESGEIHNIIRLEIRAYGAQKFEGKHLAIAQYFTTKLSAKGKVEPEQVDVGYAEIGTIDDERTYVEFPSFDFRQSSHRYRSTYSGNYTYKSGDSFYGVMVTIFDQNKQILYQAVSKPNMVDFGESASKLLEELNQ